MHYRIGQKVPLEISQDRRALFVPGTMQMREIQRDDTGRAVGSVTRQVSSMWHGLIVPPQREAETLAWLKARGVYSFFPVTRRAVTIRGKRMHRESRYLPGYVFARFPGRIIWHRVQASPFVSDAIRMSDGGVAALDWSDLEAIHAMRHVDETQRRSEAEGRKRKLAEMRSRAKINRGDRVTVPGGAFAGFGGEVLELRNGRAVVRLTLFGTVVDAELDPALIEKVDQ